MVQTSLFSYQGWVALLFIALGVGAAAKLWLKPDQPVNSQDVEVTNGTDGTPAPSQDATPTADLGGFASAVAVLDRPLVAVGATAKKDGLTDLGDGRWGMDTLGAVCPFPLIEAKNAIGKIDVGDELVIDFDCTQATDAIPRWAATDGHEVTQFEARGDAGWVIAVKRGH
jgi:TusA-related sulfurtransferase